MAVAGWKTADGTFSDTAKTITTVSLHCTESDS